VIYGDYIRMREEDYEFLLKLQRSYKFFILTISVGISAILLDYFINHYFSSDHQWPERKFYKSMLWLTVALILFLIILSEPIQWPQGII
jgi:hypothetical protein